MEGKQEQAWKLKGQAVEVTYEHVAGFVEVQYCELNSD